MPSCSMCVRHSKILKPQMLITYDCKILGSAFLLETKHSSISSNGLLRSRSCYDLVAGKRIYFTVPVIALVIKCSMLNASWSPSSTAITVGSQCHYTTNVSQSLNDTCPTLSGALCLRKINIVLIMSLISLKHKDTPYMLSAYCVMHFTTYDEYTH